MQAVASLQRMQASWQRFPEVSSLVSLCRLRQLQVCHVQGLSMSYPSDPRECMVHGKVHQEGRDGSPRKQMRELKSPVRRMPR